MRSSAFLVPLLLLVAISANQESRTSSRVPFCVFDEDIFHMITNIPYIPSPFFPAKDVLVLNGTVDGKKDSIVSLVSQKASFSPTAITFSELFKSSLHSLEWTSNLTVTFKPAAPNVTTEFYGSIIWIQKTRWVFLFFFYIYKSMNRCSTALSCSFTFIQLHGGSHVLTQ